MTVRCTADEGITRQLISVLSIRGYAKALRVCKHILQQLPLLLQQTSRLLMHDSCIGSCSSTDRAPLGCAPSLEPTDAFSKRLAPAVA